MSRVAEIQEILDEYEDGCQLAEARASRPGILAPQSTMAHWASVVKPVSHCEHCWSVPPLQLTSPPQCSICVHWVQTGPPAQAPAWPHVKVVVPTETK